MKYILSIIIPVYKVEEYIEECLNSIFSQLPDSVEIIIINDGTPDRSIEIIKLKYADWLAKDQIVLLSQENSGPGAARNSGLKVTRGKYIGFLDSDDILLEKFFSIILKVIDKYQTDIIEFGFNRFNTLSDIQKKNNSPLYKFSGLHEIKKVRKEIFSIGIWFPSTRVYKKKVFENRSFPEGVFYEDLMTIPHIFLKNLNGYFIDQALIGYRFNPNSTTALHNRSHLLDIYSFYMSLVDIERSIPTDILKIKTARGICYFYNELDFLEFPIMNVLEDIKKIEKKLTLLKTLQFPDLFFFIFTKLYMQIDRIRLRKVKRKK